MTTILRNALLSLLLCTSGAIAQQGDDGDVKMQATDEVVTVEQVPAHILASAKKALPGAYFNQVTRQLRRNDLLYFRFDASQVGRYYVLMVRDDGQIIEKYETSGPPPKRSNS